MRNPFKRQEKALTVTGGVIDALRQGGTVFPVLGGGANQRIVEAFNVAQGASYSWMYRKSPAVRTVIDTIVRNVGQLDLRLYEEVSESERQPRPDHPAALSMRYPSETSTADGLIRALFTDYLIHDNAYALLTAGVNGQVMVERIPAFMVEVRGPSLFTVEEYRVWPQGAWYTGQWAGSGTPVTFPPEQILHWHGENPLDSRVGLSRLDTLRDVTAEDAALAQAVIELANNGLQAPIWVSRPLEAPEMNAPTLKAHEEDVANRIRNRNRRPPVMIEGEKLESFGISPQDAEMLAVRRFAIERVAATYGVPAAAVGLAPATPDTTSQFYNDTLPPYCQNFAKMLNQRLLVRVFDEPDYCFEFNLDEKTGWSMLPNLIAASGRPVMLTDEARAKVNLPPVPGGDKLVTPANVIVGDNPLPSVGVMPIQDPNKPPQDGSYRTDQGPTPAGDYGQVPKSINGQSKDFNPSEPRNPHTGEWVGFGGAEEALSSWVMGHGRIVSAGKLSPEARAALIEWETGSGNKLLESRYGVATIPRGVAVAAMERIAGADWRKTYPGRDVAVGQKVPTSWPVVIDPLYHHEIADGVHRLYRQLVGGARQVQAVYPASSAGKAIVDALERKAQRAYPVQSYAPRREKDKQVQDRNISRFERSLQNYFATFSGELQSVSLPAKANSRKDVAEWQRRTSRLTGVLSRVIRETVAAEGRRYAQRFGGQFNLSDTQNYRQAMAQGSAQQINDTIRQEIVELGLATALGRLPQHAASAGASLGVKATLFARREAARQSPDVARRQETWVKDTDRHAALDGTSVQLGGVWPGGLRPGSSPGCKCTSTIS